MSLFMMRPRLEAGQRFLPRWFVFFLFRHLRERKTIVCVLPGEHLPGRRVRKRVACVRLEIHVRVLLMSAVEGGRRKEWAKRRDERGRGRTETFQFVSVAEVNLLHQPPPPVFFMG